jgi:hypothetical protein
VKIFNRYYFSAHKSIGIFLLVAVLVSIGFYFFRHQSQSLEVKSKLEVDPHDIPLNKRDEAKINISHPSQVIIPKSSDPVGTHSVIDTKVQ